MEIIFNGATYNLTNHLNNVFNILPIFCWTCYLFFGAFQFCQVNSDDEFIKAAKRTLKYMWIPTLISTLWFVNFN